MSEICKILKVDEIPDNSVTFVNAEFVDIDVLANALEFAKTDDSRNRKVIFVHGDTSGVFNTMTEDILNSMGWYRKE